MQDFRQIHFKEIDSTNDYLKNSYGLLSNFTFVTADYQNKGKGRNNRLWTSEPGENLMFSFLIKDKRLINQSLIISFVAAIEVAIVLESFGIKNVSIKWPNDVLVGDKKICGILAEGQVPDYLVVGVGLNVNQKSFPNDLRRPATSIALELDKEVPIDDIKDTLFKRIVTSLNSFDTKFYLEYYKKHNYLLNKRVRALINGQEYIGDVTGINDAFCLIVSTKERVLFIDSGEIDVISTKPSFDASLIPLVVAILAFIVGIVLLLCTLFFPAFVCLGISVIFVALWCIWYFTKGKNPKPIELNGQVIKAVIFDMDGTLIDSTSLWHEIDKQFFAKRNMPLPEDYAKNIVHLGLAQAAKFTKETYGIKESEQEIMDEWHQMSLKMYRDEIQLKEGAIEILEFFKNNRIPMAIATANDDTLYLPCIDRLGIGKYFDHIADVNNVKEGKQSAKIYEYLAEKMRANKENTLVVEDMPTCIKTAYDNGFITVAVFDQASKNYNEQKKRDSHLFVNNLNELLEKLRK